MSYIEKEKLIKADITSIENRVRHAFNQGYDLGYKEGKANCSKNSTGSTTKNDLGVDAISRADARSLISDIDLKYHTFGMTRKAFKDLYNGMDELPPVTPIRPKGHWICDGKGRSFADYHCSECGLKLALCGQDIKQRQDSGYSLFCGGCGADMREVVEE